MENKNKIIIFGLGYFGLELFKALYKNWYVIGVDVKEDKIKKVKEISTDIELISGDASSILIWKKISLNNLKHIVITIRDSDVSLEVCRIAREVFKLDIPITVFLYNPEREEEFLDFGNINIIKPANIIINSVLSLIEKNYRIATNIGYGKGEIIEVDILAKSHFVDRKLKYLKPSKWRIAAIYRNGQLIIPSGEEKIKIGDKVVIIGDPKVLENLINILLKGIPQFPLQFGFDVATIYSKKFKENISELSYFISNTRVNKVFIFPYHESDISKNINLLKQKFSKFEIKNPVSSIKSLIKFKNNISFFVIPYSNLSFFERLHLKYIFENSAKPFFLSNTKFPYKSINILLNSPDPAFTLEVGIEIARMLKIDIHTFYVAMPKGIRTDEEEEEVLNIHNIITDFENIYKISMNFKLLEGNPVKETIKHLSSLSDNNLLIMSYKKEPISFFNPNPQYLIAKKCKCSSFIIPVEELNE